MPQLPCLMKRGHRSIEVATQAEYDHHISEGWMQSLLDNEILNGIELRVRYLEEQVLMLLEARQLTQEPEETLAEAITEVVAERRKPGRPAKLKPEWETVKD